MNSNEEVKNTSLESKGAMLALSIISLALFFTEIFFEFLAFGNIQSILVIVLEIIPRAVFIYAVIRYKTHKMRFLFPIIFWSMMIKEYVIYHNVYSFESTYQIMNVFCLIILIVCFTLSSISSLMKVQKKGLLLISSALFLAFFAIQIYLSNILDRILNPYNFIAIGFVFFILCYLISLLTFGIAMLLFARINDVTSIQCNSKKITQILPEEKLLLLKRDFELGRITEEEYTTQRDDILNSL
jgi:hypothetical protein